MKGVSMKFVKPILSAHILVLLLFQANAVFAGPYTDDLSKCILESTTTDDRTALVKWMFVAFALHPAVKPLASVSKQQVEEANKQTAALVMKLLTESCTQQAQLAIKYEGQTAIRTSFQMLGQVAAKELFADPDVAAGLTGLEKYFDKNKLETSLGLKKNE